VTNIPIQNQDDEFKRGAENFNEINKNIQDLIINIEQEVDKEEQLVLPSIISNIMHSFAHNFVRF
jgi:hypothetical protein